jgi:hypothetical protein
LSVLVRAIATLCSNPDSVVHIAAPSSAFFSSSAPIADIFRAFPPLLASHAYGLRAGLIAMFQYFVTKERSYTLWD